MARPSRQSHEIELTLFLWHIPDDATEGVAEHSSRRQPSINLHAPLTSMTMMITTIKNDDDINDFEVSIDDSEYDYDNEEGTPTTMMTMTVMTSTIAMSRWRWRWRWRQLRPRRWIDDYEMMTLVMWDVITNVTTRIMTTATKTKNDYCTSSREEFVSNNNFRHLRNNSHASYFDRGARPSLDTVELLYTVNNNVFAVSANRLPLYTVNNNDVCRLCKHSLQRRLLVVWLRFRPADRRVAGSIPDSTNFLTNSSGQTTKTMVSLFTKQ